MAKANGGAARGDSGKRNLLRGHTTTLCMIVLLAIIVGLMARIAYLAIGRYSHRCIGRARHKLKRARQLSRIYPASV